MKLSLQPLLKALEQTLSAEVMNRLKALAMSQLNKTLRPNEKRLVVLSRIKEEFGKLPDAPLNLALEAIYNDFKLDIKGG
ncbi:MAG: hypothetical protein HQM08_17335 [Candidatus Riflebacteria bacterium]|nr:hypothetical protein [Candidatus Riflebacteria bacterium]